MNDIEAIAVSAYLKELMTGTGMTILGFNSKRDFTAVDCKGRSHHFVGAAVGLLEKLHAHRQYFIDRKQNVLDRIHYWRTQNSDPDQTPTGAEIARAKINSLEQEVAAIDNHVKSIEEIA